MGNCTTCDDPSIYEQNTEAKPMKNKKLHNGKAPCGSTL